MRAAVVVFLLGACAPHGPPARPASAASDAAPIDAPMPHADQERHFAIWLGGARVGSAVETETYGRTGVVVRRVETMQFARGDAEIALITTIVVVADPALVPSRITWTETGTGTRTGVGVRSPDGWRIDSGGEHQTLPADAVPAELVPLLTRRDGHFDGHVFLPARAFLVGTGRVEPAAPGRLVARLALDGGALAEATIDIDGDGNYLRVVDGEGVIATRTTATIAAAAFPLVDLIAATAIPIVGRGPHLVIDGAIALPPVPGQSARLVADGLELALSPALAGALPDEVRGPDRAGEIRDLVAAVRASIVPDLGAGTTTARQARAATAGDCTTFALAYAAYAASRAIPTRVVTGLRVDGARLIRHRWAVSWTGTAWIAVDAAFGAAPAGGDLIGLAVHDADDAGLVAGEAALTMVRTALRR